jgi:hypothetical protein
MIRWGTLVLSLRRRGPELAGAGPAGPGTAEQLATPDRRGSITG